ncbi:MAG TPA: phage portal protein, partial [Rhodoblastus sp.]|nr:phage portal protein [Rhodoblastus sp.]
MTERGAGLPRWSLSPVEISAHSRGVEGAAAWFGPSAPQAPAAPVEVAGRQWDFPSGYNLASNTRNYEAFSFADLRQLADAYDLLRLVIETRKDQIERLTWAIRPKSDATVDAAEIARVERFFQSPDGAHDWSAWMRMILEDLFVIDAPALWCERDRGGALVALHPLDGATIKPVLDAWGRTPRPFVQNGRMIYPAAYQQIIKGLPAVDYSTRDLIYRPRNVRTHRAYGFSPVEQVMATVNIGLKRQVSQLAYYSEGNIPESLIGVPDAWTPDQIKNFQDYWDLYFTGDVARRRRAKFVPGGVAKTFIQTKEPELKNAFDEWIARVVCFAFSISPQPFVQQMNRATGETQKESADQEGLLPILNWIKRLCDHVIQNLLGAPGLEFVWRHEPVIDPTVQRENLVAYVNAGMMTRRRAAQILGETLPDDPMADVLTVMTGQGVVSLNKPSEAPKGVATKMSCGDQSLDFPNRVSNGAPATRAKKFNQNHDERGRFATSSGNRDIELAASTKDFRKACKLLGIDPIDAGEAIHAAKDDRRLSGADECTFDLENGNIIFQGEIIG